MENKKISDLNQEKFTLESEKQLANNGFIDDFEESGPENLVSKGFSGMMIMGGVMVLIFTALISGKLFMLYKRREIFAFVAQQSIPVVKEGVDESSINWKYY